MTWENLLQNEREKPYFKRIDEALKRDKSKNITVYPPEHLRYSALEATPLKSVKVVILGQDPYHGPHEAHGLSFSVAQGVKIPPSLRNIFTELHHDLGVPIPKHGDLTHWTKQGVLLLNTAFSVQHKKPGSHSRIGWQQLTDKIIATVSEQQRFVVFVLWGKHAQTKAPLIDHRHMIIQTPHPSPFSAHKGFMGSKPFSKTNSALLAHQITPINW